MGRELPNYSNLRCVLVITAGLAIKPHKTSICRAFERLAGLA